jgi:oligopeptide/dipeptide ABC transporter ATP-binding protein
MSLLTISGLRKRFNLEAGFFAHFGRFVNAVNDVSFSIGNNETYGLVGESGCGKTTTARLLVRMYEADGGSILYHRDDSPSKDGAPSVNGAPSVDGGPVELASLRRDELRQYRQKVRYVFQDPARSLNPRMSVHEILVSGLRHGISAETARQLRERAATALEEVGLQAADLDRRPAEFSGGQRQRISIARGLLPQPELLICDEVVSALDVSIQAQILNLLLDIREKRARDGRSMSFLFIAHDLKVSCYFCDRIGVMYAGEIMEEAPAANLWREGHHPYTQMLFSSATGLQSPERSSSKDDAPSKDGTLSKDEPSSAKIEFTDGCSFAARCVQATERCFAEKPPLTQIAPGHMIRCHLE